MNTADLQSRQGWHLLQIGVVVLLFTSFEGFVIPYLAVPQLGLSVHRLGAVEAVLLLPMGLLWSRLRLGATGSIIAFWLLVYSALAIITAYVMAAAWGAGDSMIRLAARTGRGSVVEETAISLVAYSSAPTGIVAFALILWGLRGHAPRAEASQR
jgi:(hydroxyamino)benzene mutase